MPGFDRPRTHLAVGHRDDDLDRLEARAGRYQQRLDLAVDGRARFVREHDRLVGLAETYVHEDRVDLEAVRRRRPARPRAGSRRR